MERGILHCFARQTLAFLNRKYEMALRHVPIDPYETLALFLNPSLLVIFIFDQF